MPTALGGLLQDIPGSVTIPIEAWQQAVIVVLFSVIFLSVLGAMFAAFRGLMKDWQKFAADQTRKWSEEAEKRDREWRDFFNALNANNKDDVCRLAEMMERMLSALNASEQQGRTIIIKTEQVLVNTDIIKEAVTKPRQKAKAAE